MTTPTLGARDGRITSRLRSLDTATAAALATTLGLGGGVGGSSTVGR